MEYPVLCLITAGLLSIHIPNHVLSINHMLKEEPLQFMLTSNFTVCHFMKELLLSVKHTAGHELLIVNTQ